MHRNFDHGFDLCPLSEVIKYSCRLSGPSALSVVRSIEVVRISEVKNTLYIWQKQSVPRHESVVRRLSVTRRVRYGRFHCTLISHIQIISVLLH